MTVFDLYNCDLNFKLLMDIWVKDRVPPVSLPDLLLEWDKDREAEAVAWVINEPESIVPDGELKGLSSKPFPWKGGSNWSWWVERNREREPERVPYPVFKGLNRTNWEGTYYCYYPSPLEALLDLLQAWYYALENGANLPRFLTGVK